MYGAELMELCDVWGELVELCRRCVGSVGGIVQTMCAICFELRTIKYLSGTAVLFCTYTSCLLYEVTSQERDFRWLWGEKSRLFPSENFINNDWLGEVFQLQYS